MAIPFFLTKLLVRTRLARLFPQARRLAAGGTAYLHYYADRVLAAPHEELAAAAPYWREHGPEVIDLTQGTPRFDILPSTTTKLPSDRRGYPPAWGLPELRGAVADWLRAEQGLSVSPQDEVLITAGAAGAFATAIATFVNAGDRVALFDPASPLHIAVLKQQRARIHWIPTWMEDGYTRFRLEHLVKALGRVKLLILTAPNNPTGGVVRNEDLEALAWWAERRDVLLISDDVFHHYWYDGLRHGLATFPKAGARTVTIGSLSKSHALTAARVGWLAGHRHLVRPCALTNLLQAGLVPTLCQQIALNALRHADQSLAAPRADWASQRRYVFERVRTAGLEPAWPSGGLFLWLPVHHLGLTGRAFAERLAHAQRVLVWPGEFFGPSGAGHVRLSYVAEEGRLREGVARLSAFCRELSGLSPAPPCRAAA
ncbi:MAG: pyridoxal phosphate-dependent aminotransferase [Gemmataceae bacterium]